MSILVSSVVKSRFVTVLSTHTGWTTQKRFLTNGVTYTCITNATAAISGEAVLIFGKTMLCKARSLIASRRHVIVKDSPTTTSCIYTESNNG